LKFTTSLEDWPQFGFKSNKHSIDNQKHVGYHEKGSDSNNEPADVLTRFPLYKRGMHFIGSIVGEASHQQGR
jgi:hypothetical protein